MPKRTAPSPFRLGGDSASIILDSLTEGVFTVDRDWRITSFNKAASIITGIPRPSALGRPCCEVFRANICETSCALRQTMESGRPVLNRSIFVVNPHGERIPISVSTALLRDRGGRLIGGVETFRDLTLVEELRKELLHQRSIGDIVTQSPRMAPILEMIPAAADSGSTVLLLGESGTGKELVARALHSLSPRRAGPLVTVNCGALPENLLESELFGYKKGAFTDARHDKPGRFALAAGGTLFLDEIGDLPLSLQVKLLRVIQERTFEPLGSTRPEKADVRLIAATNRDLGTLVRERRFRQDLYYRVNVLSIALPPLRERPEDIPLLVSHFIQRFNLTRGTAVTGIAPAALQLIMAHEFPGNVRELENLIEHAFIFCRKGPIKPDHLPAEFRARPGAGAPEAASLEELESRFLKQVMARHGFDRTAAARELGIHPVTLWRKLKRYGL
ncbi:MAG: sigma 54-interacting transcriptional regulator [Candidatus Riflebacteria bacterium]|nr:sigma 54-interacting transcriptional regulator [Candidatus Riflebacteria bacterium]